MMLTTEMNMTNLAMLGAARQDGEVSIMPMARMLDTDGDGRNDLFLVDFDLDGKVDGVVRALDTDGDGVADLYVNYDQDGEIQSIGHINPESGEYEVLAEDAEGFDDLLSTLDSGASPPPDAALFTTFDDPYFMSSFGTTGEVVPESGEADAAYADFTLRELDEDEYAATQNAASTDEAELDTLPETSARVVEIEDYSGAGDGSDLHAKVDQDGDGLADNDVRLFRTSDGTWHGDIDNNGYSEGVAFDPDRDGHIDSVDTGGRGSSSDVVGAEQVVAPASADIVDRSPGEDDQADADLSAASAEFEAELPAADNDMNAEGYAAQPDTEIDTTTQDSLATQPEETDTDTV